MVNTAYPTQDKREYGARDEDEDDHVIGRRSPRTRQTHTCTSTGTGTQRDRDSLHVRDVER